MRDYGKHLRCSCAGHLRRRRHAARRSTRSSAASTSSSPRRAACSITCGQKHRRSVARRDPGARRSRSHARHGLHARHQAHPRAAAASSGRTCCSRRRSRDEIRALADKLLRNPVVDRGARRATRPPSWSTSSVHPVERDRKRELLAHLIKDQPLAPGAGVHAHQARRQPPRRASRQATASPRWRSTATRARTRARARWPISRPASCRCWSPPTSPRAASTSSSCRTSSTSTCRTCPRTTCTASAAPAAPARPARRSRWCAARSSAAARHRAADQAPDPAHDGAELSAVRRGWRDTRSRAAPGRAPHAPQTDAAALGTRAPPHDAINRARPRVAGRAESSPPAQPGRPRSVQRDAGRATRSSQSSDGSHAAAASEGRKTKRHDITRAGGHTARDASGAQRRFAGAHQHPGVHAAAARRGR